MLGQGIAWKPGSGTQIRILCDIWVSSDLVSFKSSVNGLGCPTHVSALFELRSYAWNVGMVRRLFPDTISSQILALERPSSDRDDFIYWKFALDGKFLVRFVMRCFFILLIMQPGFVLFLLLLGGSDFGA